MSLFVEGRVIDSEFRKGKSQNGADYAFWTTWVKQGDMDRIEVTSDDELGEVGSPVKVPVYVSAKVNNGRAVARINVSKKGK